jgi:hypothetical protein
MPHGCAFEGSRKGLQRWAQVRHARDQCAREMGLHAGRCGHRLVPLQHHVFRGLRIQSVARRAWSRAMSSLSHVGGSSAQDVSFAVGDGRTQQRQTSRRNLLGRCGAHGRPGIAIVEPIRAHDQAHDESGAGEHPQQQARPRRAYDRARRGSLVMHRAGRVSDVLGRSLASATQAACALPPRGRVAGAR